jgi:hypothetical protein
VIGDDMIRCGHCDAQQLDGTIFCSECGASLLNTGARRETTAALNKADSDDAIPLVEEASATIVPAPLATTSEKTITLVVINSGRRIVLEADTQLLIGRKDNARGIYPDIDLGLDGGYDAGVSRRHALIAPNDEGFVLEDLGSANGTFINERQLSPNHPTPIVHGDEICLGTLILRFEPGSA